MDWKEKMTEAMKLIVEACKENPNWTNCKYCPFDSHCTAIYEYSDQGLTPDDDGWLDIT